MVHSREAEAPTSPPRPAPPGEAQSPPNFSERTEGRSSGKAVGGLPLIFLCPWASSRSPPRSVLQACSPREGGPSEVPAKGLTGAVPGRPPPSTVLCKLPRPAALLALPSRDCYLGEC